eukprot:TRINITY_DN26290_c0_g1_i1.p1 TRINITY_DN26290_c0_g1~~TRINITY_DN26290_c0_g1_i1.p1  ORF type:complete len:131 (+),score=11.95 TRINITY_DN26290_c0_g1_i1:52-444(+)
MDVPATVRVTAATLDRIAAREAAQASGLSEVAATKLPTHAVGSRCEVAPGGRRGTVCYVGRPGGIDRPLIAVELDEPQGSDLQKGGAWIDGQVYFEPSNPDSAVVWKTPADVICGDFPALDPFADLGDSD